MRTMTFTYTEELALAKYNVYIVLLSGLSVTFSVLSLLSFFISSSTSIFFGGGGCDWISTVLPFSSLPCSLPVK